MKLSLNYTITQKKKKTINKLINILLSSLSKTFANWSAQYVCIIINYISVHQGRELSSNQVNKSIELLSLFVLVAQLHNDRIIIRLQITTYGGVILSHLRNEQQKENLRT